jgi:glycosyltransferase involved in cell wall biosynthesis
MKIVFLGGRGIPACYSGYDTLIEELSVRLALDPSNEVSVYCRKSYYSEYPAYYKGVKLYYFPAPHFKGFESLFHSLVSTLHAILKKADIIYFVDPANVPFCVLIRLFGKKVIIHADGLGWKRRKWSGLARAYYKAAERLSARCASVLITDNPEMKAYYQCEYDADSALIAYGAFNDYGLDKNALQAFGLIWKRYHLVVARLEPENNTDFIIREYIQSKCSCPLIIVGDAPYDSSYFDYLKDLSDDRVKFLGRIHDQKILNSLYEGAFLYIHGHEVGGTNPSLLRAMGQGVAPLVLDVGFNRTVINSSGFTFSKMSGLLSKELERLENIPEEVFRIGRCAYARAEAAFTWDQVTQEHIKLFASLFKLLS